MDPADATIRELVAALRQELAEGQPGAWLRRQAAAVGQWAHRHGRPLAVVGWAAGSTTLAVVVDVAAPGVRLASLIWAVYAVALWKLFRLMDSWNAPEHPPGKEKAA